MNGLFISFEGGEGAGKTSQIQLLYDRLNSHGFEVLTTREPGGTPESERIRDLLVHRQGGDWDPLCECMLFFTARRLHVERLIKPALQEGKIIICDRFTDSTIAYQGYGHGFDLRLIQQIQHLSIGNFQPDVTFLLDIPAEAGLRRSKKRLSQDKSEEDRFEKLNLSFHENLRQGFLTLAYQEPERFEIIQADAELETISNEIYTAVKQKIKL